MHNKYNVGDLVDFLGNKAIVRKVREDFYFGIGSDPFYMYEIERTDSGAVHEVHEPAISLISKKSLTEGLKRNNLCECGAWAVHWATEAHSSWCPEWRYFK